jgi:hypothetical protein
MFRKFSAGTLTSALLLVGAVACSDDETGPDLETNFTATLTGAAERPPVTTTATGTSTVTINDANSSITFNVSVTNLLSPTMAHIHVGSTSQDNPVFALSLLATAPATGLFTGVLAAGTAAGSSVVGGETFATLAAAIRSGNAYINVHTVANPGGELRGQLVAQ